MDFLESVAVSDAAEPAEPVKSDGPDLRAELLADVREGLRSPQKQLPCKWLYDARGSRLFERICTLEEYYPTRTELGIMEAHASAMAALLGEGCAVIEYGSGSSLKTHLLLRYLRHPAAYLPVDISPAALADATLRLRRSFPALDVRPVCGDFTGPIALPLHELGERRRAVYFPGSTIGNFHKPDVVGFLRRIAAQCGRGGALLIGVDLRKEPEVLLRAYDDASGVTAAFDLNLLVRIARELDAEVHPEQFRHEARWNDRHGRIEMHLVSIVDQRITVAGEAFHLAAGESVWTESSYKYDLGEFAALAALGGWRCERAWTDERAWFSVQYLTAR